MKIVRIELMVAFLLSALSYLSQSANATTDPVVTFYSAGSVMSTGMPGSKHGIFRGAIFDGQQRLVLLRRNNFVTMKFSPGQHIFSASLSGKHPAENSQLPLALEGGKSYFIRVQSESSGVMVVEFEKGRLDVMTCQTAHAELTKATPAKKEDISKAVMDRVLSEQSLPPCH